MDSNISSGYHSETWRVHGALARVNSKSENKGHRRMNDQEGSVRIMAVKFRERPAAARRSRICIFQILAM